MKSRTLKYNFIQTKRGELNKYYDKDNAVVLYIFKSGWYNLYNCVLEWCEYERSEIKTITPFQIEKWYGIKTFSRKEKLLKIIVLWKSRHFLNLRIMNGPFFNLLISKNSGNMSKMNEQFLK